MNSTIKLLCITLGVFAMTFSSISTAWAQYEGTFRLSVYNISEDNAEQTLVNRFHFTATPNRILFRDVNGIRTLDAMMGMPVKRILLRNDRQDFAFIGDQQAVTLAKQQLVALSNMMKSMQQQGGQTIQPNNPEFVLRETSEKKEINGYQTTKWVAETDEVAIYYNIWITNDININWGMLSESWLTDIGLFQGFPDQDWMSDNQTPVLIERYDNYKLSEVVQFDQFKEGAVADSEVSMPANLPTLTFQQLLMKRMGQ